MRKRLLVNTACLAYMLVRSAFTLALYLSPYLLEVESGGAALPHQANVSDLLGICYFGAK